MDKELTEFLNRKFSAIDEKFAGMDQKFDVVDGKFEEVKRHFGVVAEGLEHKIQLVAEGVANVDETLERFRREVQEEFKEVKFMTSFSMLS